MSYDVGIRINADGTAAVTGVKQVEDAMEKMSSSGKNALDSLSNKGRNALDALQTSWVNAAAGFYLIKEAIYAASKAYEFLAGAAVETGTEFSKVSQQINLSVENLSALKYAAELSETSYEALTVGIGFFSRSLHGMNEEGKDTSKTLKSLGIDSTDTHTALLQAADAFSKMENNANKTALAMELFGRGGRAMLPLLNEGAAGISELEEKAHELGVTFTTEGARAAKEYGDQIKELESQISGLSFTIGSYLIPRLSTLFNMLLSEGRERNDSANLIRAIDHSIKEKMIIMDRLQNPVWSSIYAGLGIDINKLNNELLKLQQQRDSLVSAYNNKYFPEEKATSPAPTPANDDAIKKIEDATKIIQDNIAKNTMSAFQLIDREAEAYKALGVDKNLVNQWVASENAKLSEVIMKKYHEEEKAAEQLEQKKRGLAVETMLSNEEQMERNIIEKQRLAEIERQYEIEKANELHQIQMNLVAAERDFKIQAYQESWQAMFDMANQVGGEMGQGFGMMLGGMKGTMDIEQGYDPYTAQLDQLQEFMRQKMALHLEGKISEQQMEDYFNQTSLQMDALTNQQKLSMYQNYASSMAGAMLALSNTGGSIAKAAFVAYKAFKIAETAISTYSAATAALAPPPIGLGPVFGIPLAAAVTVMGLAQIAMIARQQPGNAATGGGSMSVGGGYSYNQPSEPRFQKDETTAQPRSQVVNHYYIIDGPVYDLDQTARKLVPAIEKAQVDMGRY